MTTGATLIDPKPLYIRMHEDDNVAIVANDFGLPQGARFAAA